MAKFATHKAIAFPFKSKIIIFRLVIRFLFVLFVQLVQFVIQQICLTCNLLSFSSLGLLSVGVFNDDVSDRISKQKLLVLMLTLLFVVIP